MTVKGILWDNDGVLVDTEHLFYAVNRALLLEHDIDLSCGNPLHRAAPPAHAPVPV